MKYERPEIEVIRFGEDDVIITSSGTPLPWDETEENSSSMFNLF